MKVAGIDVHKKVLMVVVVDASTPEEKPARRRSKETMEQVSKLLDMRWVVSIEKSGEDYRYFTMSGHSAEILYDESPDFLGAFVGLGPAPNIG